MDKQNKGLADNGDGQFILNESGTSVSTDPVLPMAQPSPVIELVQEEPTENEPEITNEPADVQEQSPELFNNFPDKNNDAMEEDPANAGA